MNRFTPDRVMHRIIWLRRHGRRAEADALAAIEWKSEFESWLDSMTELFEEVGSTIGAALIPVLSAMSDALLGIKSDD